eukprot:scaffold153998_cov28-Tisochrysis_lutea.AAC.2
MRPLAKLTEIGPPLLKRQTVRNGDGFLLAKRDAFGNIRRRTSNKHKAEMLEGGTRDMAW